MFLFYQNSIFLCFRNAQPIEKLKTAYKKFFARCLTRPKATEDDLTEKHLPIRSFGTVLARGENRIMQFPYIKIQILVLAWFINQMFQTMN
uniref:Uncharacterized protein n=1 Tax=Vitis vinifera TaxID=29760 RepID=F6H604_VITVI